MHKALRWTLFIILVFFPAILRPGQAAANGVSRPAAQGTILAMVAPSACPASGCAAGQRINLRFDFELSIYSPSAAGSNVKVCYYAPTLWGITPDNPDTVQGEISGKTYQRVDGCDEDTAKPEGYSLISAREAAINITTFSDSIPLPFRFAPTATGSGRIVARLFERASNNEPASFTRTQQSTTATLTVIPPAATVYAANDAASCGTSSPCYLNSADDLAAGVGTGLRDAVEAIASNSTIYILGPYTVKGSTVFIDKPLTLSGMNDSSLTYTAGTACSQPLLSLRSNVTLRNLTINDGNCANPGRSLVEVDSSEPVLIESNDLVNGDNAIFIRDNSGAVTVRFNHITGNTGYAVFELGHSNASALEVTANNLNGNRSGGAVECSAAATTAVPNRKANHNYWGGAAPGADISHCTIAAGKRLGAAVALKSGAPGLNAQLVTVGSNKTYAFESQIAYRRNGGADFNLFVIDHGFLNDGGAPFTTSAGGDSPSPCSNYWDVFLPDGTAPSGALEFSIKYDKSPACLAAINSMQYCDQTASPEKYPLYWYDPATNATKWWDTTGQRPENLTSGEGQATSCNISASEIQVSIDASGRPNLTNDLNYTPFMVGIPILRSFLPLASNQNITVTWTTNNEPDVSGYYVLRSQDGVNFTPISDLIAKRGTALTGVISPAYAFVDTGRVNGVIYYYRLQIVRTDGKSLYSVIYSLAANVATITPTFTASPIFTRTAPYPTSTFPATRIPPRFPTSIPTRTFTPRPVVTTVTPFSLFTRTPTGQGAGTQAWLATPDATQAALGTLVFPVSGSQTPGVELSETPSNEPAAETATNTPSPTPSETSFPDTASQTSNGPGSWVSLLLGLLAGIAVVGSVGGWGYFRAKGQIH